MTYGISCANGPRVTSDQIMKAFDHMGMATPKELAEIVIHGIRYSNQDFDVLQSCMARVYHMRQDAWQWVATF
jgi:hypothetical protein